jgi:hypothetical protein
MESPEAYENRSLRRKVVELIAERDAARKELCEHHFGGEPRLEDLERVAQSRGWGYLYALDRLSRLDEELGLK